MTTRRRVLAIAAGAAFTATLAAITACTQKPQFHAIDLTGADYAKDFRMPDQDGQVRTLQDFRGKLVVMFFGYTQCPDVCPTTMSELAEAKRIMGADGAKVQGIFVTIDPERDTPQLLKAYMANFDPTFIALRGTAEETAKLASEYKVFYKKVPGPTPTSYTMDHTAASYVYDTQGRLRLYTRYGSGAPALASDLQQLLKQG